MTTTTLHANSAAMSNQQRVSAIIYHSLYFLLTSQLSAYEGIEITTRSHPEAFPSALRQKRKTQTKQHDKGDQGTLVRIYFRLPLSEILIHALNPPGVRKMPFMRTLARVV